jgi:tetratricopeptide (TPR) repeat protein
LVYFCGKAEELTEAKDFYQQMGDFGQSERVLEERAHAANLILAFYLRHNQQQAARAFYEAELATSDLLTPAKYTASFSSTLKNLPEILLVLGMPEEAAKRAQEALNLLDPKDYKSGIMSFCLWLAGAVPLDKALEAASALDTTEKWNWNWSDIRPVIEALLPESKRQAECVVAFFSDHRDVHTLRACVEANG